LYEGSGGLGAVSIGISETLIGLIVVIVLLFGLWKLVKLVWAAFSN
jgi:hypothetical protein